MNFANNFKLRKCYAIPLTFIGGTFLWANGFLFFPILSGNTLKHPLGYSITVNKNTIACVTGTGFMIKTQGPTSMIAPPPPSLLLKSKVPSPKEPQCVGSQTSTQTNASNRPIRPPSSYFILFIQIDAQSFSPPSQEACTVAYKQHSRQRGLRKVEITLCSNGDGSAAYADDYDTYGVAQYDGKFFTAKGYMRMGGWENYDYMWDSLLTIKRAPSGH